MPNKLPDYQTIEDVFKAANEVIAKLPDSTEARSAKRNLEVAQKLTFEARERAKAATLTIETRVTSAAEAVCDAWVSRYEERGPALAGWPWTSAPGC